MYPAFQMKAASKPYCLGHWYHHPYYLYLKKSIYPLHKQNLKQIPPVNGGILYFPVHHRLTFITYFRKNISPSDKFKFFLQTSVALPAGRSRYPYTHPSSSGYLKSPFTSQKDRGRWIRPWARFPPLPQVWGKARAVFSRTAALPNL